MKPTITIEDLRERIRLHDLYAKGEEGGVRLELPGAVFPEIDLRSANLRSANLSWANLSSANLRSADLRSADLRSADLRSADLYQMGRDLGHLPSGQAVLWATPDGWMIRVGCWTGTPDALRKLVAADEDWPEARTQVARDDRRLFLLAALALADWHMGKYPALIAELAAKWPPKAEPAEVGS